MTDDTPEKHCPGCDEDWPLTPEFWYRNRAKPDGWASQCKACHGEFPSQKDRNRRPVTAPGC